MVDKKLIQETIIELLDANVDKDTIFETLKDIGVDLEDIKQNYKEIIDQKEKGTLDEKKDIPKEETLKEEAVLEDKNTDQEDDNLDKKEDKEKKDTQDIFENNKKIDFLEKNKNRKEDDLEIDLKKSSDHIDKINQEYDKINKKEISVSSNKQLEDIEEEIREIKAKLNMLTKIMKDILDENRKILTKI